MTTPHFKVEGVLGMLTIKLRDDNFAKWAFQFQSVIRGYKSFGHFDGTIVCPPKFVALKLLLQKKSLGLSLIGSLQTLNC